MSATTLVQARRTSTLEVGWLALRPDRAMSSGDVAATISGIACMAFGIGRHGATWLDRLARSSWFRGLEPTAQDLATARGRTAGSVSRSPIYGARPLYPEVPMATVAVSRFASDAERDATVELVGELRQRPSGSCMRMAVVATVEQGAGMARRLAAEGSFVIEGGAGISAQHLHHFPLRAAIPPVVGRIVCADLADHLVTWVPGGRSRLHSIPREANAAEKHLRRAIKAGTIPVAARPLNLHWLQSGRPQCMLTGLDALAARLTKVFGDNSASWVCTDAEPMGDPGERADLLLLTN